MGSALSTKSPSGATSHADASGATSYADAGSITGPAPVRRSIGVSAHKALCKNALQGAKLHRDDREELLLKCFQSWDDNGDGVITVKELERTLSELGVKVSSSEAAKIFAVADIDKDGTISFAELCHWLCSSPRLLEYFRLIESMHSGLMGELGKPITDEHYQDIKKSIGSSIKTQFPPLIEALLDDSDTNCNGKLEEDESIIFFGNFVEEMMQTPQIIEAIVGLVTHSCSADIIDELVENTMKKAEVAGYNESTRARVELKLRNAVCNDIMITRRSIETSAELQRDAYVAAFNVMDKDKDGRLCKSEMARCLVPSFSNKTCRRFLSALGLMKTDAEIKQIAELHVHHLIAETNHSAGLEARRQQDAGWLTAPPM